ncbi:Permeases of the drug/metabolite transporter (DMT) superfamily [gamma proteobacterium IMCC1989]|nr:Permeases of the drug/metabolite transporter (DMT) superfamily [gamma proteobacterium IMCC1989]
MKISTAHLTLYTSIFLLGLNGLFSNGLPIDATTLTHIRSVFAGITLVLFIIFTQGTIKLPNVKSVFIVYGIGILLGLHWVTFFYAMQSASVAIGMLSLYTYPIITILIEPFFTRKKIQLLDIALAVLVLAGLCIIVSDHLDSVFSNNDNTQSFNIIIGVVSGILSAAFFAFRNTLQKYCCSHVKSDTLMLHQMILITIMLFLFIDTPALSQLNNTQWFYVVILGVLTTAIAHTLLVKSYKLFAAKTVAMVSCLQPVLGSFFAWLILNESVSVYTAIGGSIILGVAIYESTKAPA